MAETHLKERSYKRQTLILLYVVKKLQASKKTPANAPEKYSHTNVVNNLPELVIDATRKVEEMKMQIGGIKIISPGVYKPRPGGWGINIGETWISNDSIQLYKDYFAAIDRLMSPDGIVEFFSCQTWREKGFLVEMSKMLSHRQVIAYIGNQSSDDPGKIAGEKDAVVCSTEICEMLHH